MRGIIENINWNFKSGILELEGDAYIEGENINFDHKVKKSIIITKDEKKYYIPMKNILKTDVTTEKGEDKYNYDYSGFSGRINLCVLDELGPLSEGVWNIKLLINANGRKEEIELEADTFIKRDTKEVMLSEFGQAVEIWVEVNGKSLNIISKKIEIVSHKYIQMRKKKNTILVKIKKTAVAIKRDIGNKTLQWLYKLNKKRNIKKNRVVFLSDSRTDFTGNFKFIKEELDQRGGYEIKSILKESIKAKRSMKEMYDLVYYIATSRYILLDDYYPQIYKFKIRDGVDVIQLWHATGAFKTFGFSRLGKVGGPKLASKNHRNYTKAIVSSTDIKGHYAEAFGISENKVVATGIPRTDIFFDNKYKENVEERIYGQFPKLKEKKVILFAPTFRGSGQKTANYNFEKFDIEKMYEALGEEYHLVIKLHPFIKENFEIPDNCKDFVVDMSVEREINDILFITDILITDYSSVCFEYALLNKPMIFFAYDLEEYISTRDFYYPYETFVPGPIVKTTDEIVTKVKNSDFEMQKLKGFRETFFDHFDGQSTQRVVDKLLS